MSKEIRKSGWIGFDLDGTLAAYGHPTTDVNHIGEPIPAMIKILRQKLAEGWEVRIMTARACKHKGRAASIRAVQAWCLKHIGVVLSVTNEKDFEMVCLYDDRAVAVEYDTGRILGGIDSSDYVNEP